MDSLTGTAPLYPHPDPALVDRASVTAMARYAAIAAGVLHGGDAYGGGWEWEVHHAIAQHRPERLREIIASPPPSPFARSDGRRGEFGVVVREIAEQAPGGAGGLGPGWLQQLRGVYEDAYRRGWRHAVRSSVRPIAREVRQMRAR